MSGFLTGVVSIVDHEGNRVDTPNVDGDHAPVELQLGSTMTATKTTNGSLTRVTLNATGGAGGVVLALDTHDDFRELDIVDVPDGTVIHFKTPVGVYVYEDSLGAGQVDDDRTILKLDAVSAGSNGRAYSVDAPSLPTIAALRLAVAGKNATIQVQTYAAAGDDGGGIFDYDPSDTTSADNGGTIIVAGSCRYKRRFSGALNVRWFGARGDVFETVGTNDTGAFVAALAASNVRKCDVYIPAGIYKITGALTVPPNTRVFGEGWDTSIIYYTGITYTGSPGGTMVIHGAYLLFNVEPGTGFFNDPPKEQNITFEHLQITGDNGPSKANPDGVFVQTDGAQQVGHCTIYVRETAGGGQSSGNVYLRNCKILNQYSFPFRSDSAYGTRKSITDCHFENCAGDINPNGREAIFSRNTVIQCWGVEIAGSRIDISNNIMRDMTAGGISIGGHTGSADGEFIDDYDSATRLGDFNVRCCDNVIDGVYKTPENIGGTAIAFSTPIVGAIIARNHIINCAEHGIIQTTSDAFPPPAAVPSYCLILDNVIQSLGNIGIWIGLGGTHNVIRGNKVTSNSNTNRGGLTTHIGIALTSGLTDRFVVTDNQAVGWGYGYNLDNCKNVRWENNIGSVNFQDGNGQSTFLQDGSTQTVAATGSTDILKLTTTVDVTANGSVTVVLPNPAHVGARFRQTINTAPSQLGTTTLDSASGTIDDAATIVLVGPNQSVTVESDATNWRIVGRNAGAQTRRKDAISGATSYGFAGSSPDMTLTTNWTLVWASADGVHNVTLKRTGATNGAVIEFALWGTGEVSLTFFDETSGELGTLEGSGVIPASVTTPMYGKFVFLDSTDGWVPFDRGDLVAP